MMVSTSVFAQNNITSSPYSLFGIGDPLSLNNTIGFSMGDVKYAMTRPFYLNYANPSSYSDLKAVTFSVGAMLNRTRTFNSETSQDNDNATLRYFGLGIPLTDRMGISIGARPYTSLGYGIKINSETTYPSTLETRYEGQGGMNIVYGGLGYEILKDSINSLNLGVNANYYTGNNKQTALNKLNNTTGALSSLYSSTYVTSDFGFDIGLNYSVNLTQLLHSKSHKEQNITLGGTYSIPTHLKTRFEHFAGSYYSTSTVAIITDTLEYSLDTTSIYTPTRFGIGINYQIMNRHTNSLWVIEADYEFNGWSGLTINNKETHLKNSERYSIGAQFIPNANGIRDFFSILRYRVGANYHATRITLGGQQIVDMSLSAGFGIPLVKSKSIYSGASTVDFGVLVGSRGTVDNGLIREQYTNIYIGLSFSPNFWDRWFKKRKIN